MTTDQGEYTAIPVRLHPDDLDALIKGQGKQRRRRAIRTNTYFLTAASPVQPILPQANNRVEAWITSIVAQALNEPANPAAGASFTFTITQACQLESAFFKLVTSATVANRSMTLTISDAGGNLIFEATNGTPTPASTTTSFALAQGGNQLNSSFQATASLPVNLTLQPGWTISFTASSLQAADQISNISFTLTTPNTVTVAPSQAGANAQGGGSSQISGAISLPFPLNTTDQLWAAASASLPVTISVMAIYEEDE